MSPITKSNGHNHKKPYNLTLSLKNMIDIQEKKNKIISFLKENGPSLPVRIAKIIEMEPVFTSAILAELLGEKQIKTSHIRVGSSPLYLLSGQEQKLENYTENLKPIEKEAISKLKENKILTDENEEPAIRVALRNTKDFAIPFKSQEKIKWKYAFDQKEPSKKEKSPPPQKKEKIKKEKDKNPQSKNQDSESKTHSSKNENKQKIENIFNEEKPEFLNEIKSFLQKKEIEFIEEIQSEKKEIVAKIKINSTLGEINFLLIAKNKRTISKEEISASIQRAQYNKMPCLLIIRKTPSKAIQKAINENNLIKLLIM